MNIAAGEVTVALDASWLDLRKIVLVVVRQDSNVDMQKHSLSTNQSCFHIRSVTHRLLDHEPNHTHSSGANAAFGIPSSSSEKRHDI